MTEALPFLNSLNALPGIRAGWIERIPDFPITGGRDMAMARLRPFHEKAVSRFGGPSADWWRAEQIHGNAVAVTPGSPRVIASDGLPVVPGVDGLITRSPGIVLAIYVADCGAIWLADPKSGAVGLLMSVLAPTQIIAAVLSFVALGVLFTVGIGEFVLDGTAREVCAYLSMWGHMQSFAKGVVDTRYLVFDLSVAVLAVGLSIGALKARRHG